MPIMSCDRPYVLSVSKKHGGVEDDVVLGVHSF